MMARGYGSTRVVIRDHSGGVIVAAHSFVPYVIDASMVETYALKEGLLLAQHIGGNRLVIHSDCMEVVETMNEGGFLNILYGAGSRKARLSTAIEILIV